MQLVPRADAELLIGQRFETVQRFLDTLEAVQVQRAMLHPVVPPSPAPLPSAGVPAGTAPAGPAAQTALAAVSLDAFGGPAAGLDALEAHLLRRKAEMDASDAEGARLKRLDTLMATVYGRSAETSASSNPPPAPAPAPSASTSMEDKFDKLLHAFEQLGNKPSYNNNNGRGGGRGRGRRGGGGGSGWHQQSGAQWQGGYGYPPPFPQQYYGAGPAGPMYNNGGQQAGGTSNLPAIQWHPDQQQQQNTAPMGSAVFQHPRQRPPPRCYFCNEIGHVVLNCKEKAYFLGQNRR